MSVYDDIRSALEVRLSTTTDIPDISYENVKYVPTTGTPYIQSRVIYSSRVPAVRGLNQSTGQPHQHRYRGVFQLLLHYPEDVGSSASQEMVNTLIDRFESSTDISFTNSDPKTIYVTVDYSEQMGAYNRSPWYVTPVNINWYCYDT